MGENKMSEEEQKTPIVQLPVLEAMKRVLPQYDFEKRYDENNKQLRTILESHLAEKPGHYAVNLQGFMDPPGGIIIKVDVDEYLTLLKQMIQDDTAILDHVDKFPNQYLMEIENYLKGWEVIDKEGSLDLENNQDNRIFLIRRFFGLGHKNAYIAASLDTEIFSPEDFEETGKIRGPVIDWMKNTLLEGYRAHKYILKYSVEDIEKGERSLADFADVTSMDDLATSLQLPLTHAESELSAYFAASSFTFCSAGISPNSLSFHFSTSGYPSNRIDRHFPSGNKEMDMKRFNELERLMNTIRANPNVESMLYHPGPYVLINPMYERTQTVK